MGMYTRLALNVAIKPDAPILAELALMVKGEGTGEGRRAWMLGACSAYHEAINVVSLTLDDFDGEHKFSVCCDLKNYDGEIEWFIDWLAPHVVTQHLAGYSRYEEATAPTLIWFIAGKVVTVTPDCTSIEALQEY